MTHFSNIRLEVKIRDISGPQNEIILGNQLSHHRSDSANISFESWKSALFEFINGLFMGHSPVKRQSAQLRLFPPI